MHNYGFLYAVKLIKDIVMTQVIPQVSPGYSSFEIKGDLIKSGLEPESALLIVGRKGYITLWNVGVHLPII